MGPIAAYIADPHANLTSLAPPLQEACREAAALVRQEVTHATKDIWHHLATADDVLQGLSNSQLATLYRAALLAGTDAPRDCRALIRSIKAAQKALPQAPVPSAAPRKRGREEEPPLPQMELYDTILHISDDSRAKRLPEKSYHAIEALLRVGANINAPTDEGDTCLHLCMACAPSMIPWLLRHGANPNLTDAEGRTPLHLAIAKGLPLDLVSLLCTRETVNARDAKGLTPSAFLNTYSDADRPEIEQYLQENGATPRTTVRFAKESDHEHHNGTRGTAPTRTQDADLDLKDDAYQKRFRRTNNQSAS